MTERNPGGVYSQDYWDIVLAQLKRRGSVLFSLTVLVFLYAFAIYAPLIANDRPLYFRGVDYGAYKKAQREMALGARSLVERFEKGEPESKLIQDVLREKEAIELRVGTLRRQLALSDRELLQELTRQLARTVRLAEGGSLPEARASAEATRELVERVRAELKPALPGEKPVPGEKVALNPYTSYPALENLGRGDVFFMSMWALVLVWPIWNRLVNRQVLRGDRFRIRRARKVKLSAFVVLPLLAALLWQGSASEFFASPYKEGLTERTIVADEIIFPIIPYGIAESSDSEYFRPPTWHLEATISEDGYYLHGPRSARVDEVTGIPKLASPVGVRVGELDRNQALRHAMGTDSLGRDLLARVCWGGRVSLAVGLVSTIILTLIGTVIGSLAGYYGGWVDMLLSRLIEIVQTFPVFFLILILVAFLGPSILNIMVVIGLVRWTGVARLVRGEFIRLREQDFVVASQALGVRNTRTIFRHVLPNAMSPVLVAATFSVAAGILIESGLSFLGFGIQLPVPSWGSLFIESRSAEHWWIQIFPGILIFLTVLLYNLLGEGVRDALDPRLKGTT
jgi:peptide/nickel transport system permease protein